MTVAEAPSGSVVDILVRGTAGMYRSGRIVKIDHIDAGSGRVHAWRNFRQGKTMLFPGTECVLVDPADVDMLEYKF